MAEVLSGFTQGGDCFLVMDQGRPLEDVTSEMGLKVEYYWTNGNYKVGSPHKDTEIKLACINKWS